MNKSILKSYINLYKEEFERIHRQEIYKWKAVKQFQDNWNLDADNFHQMLKDSLKLTKNLLDSDNTYPRRMIWANADKSPNELKMLFENLFKEEDDIAERINSFKSEIKILNERNFPGKKGYQGHRAIVVYLTLMYPERFFFYKFGMFKSFIELIEYPYKPIKGRISNIGQFNNLCNLIKPELVKDQDLLKLHKNRISDNCYYDENLNILTQDFIYAVVRHLDKIESSESEDTIESNLSQQDTSDIMVGNPKISFTPKLVNHIQNNIENKRIGDLGEIWVLKRERKKLIEAGKENLANKVDHKSKNKGDGLGYDILSYNLANKKIYIEVKTTKGDYNSTFYITRNELEKSKIEKENYYLYRVYNYKEETKQADLMILNGDLSNLCKVPINYKVDILKKI